MNFSESTHHFIKNNNLLSNNDKVIVAVSGGVDSMVLAHVLNKLGYDIHIAHVNFQLRGEESDGDEAFVFEYFLAQNILVSSIQVETKKFALENNFSTQVAARELRYNWFETLLVELGISSIALAHHQDDSVETILYNLFKAKETQILKGIGVRHNSVIRPLLWATKKQIMEYSAKNNIPFRQDASNFSNDYQRNFIRNEILPKLKELNPSIENQLIERTELYKSQFDTHIQLLDNYLPSILAVKDNEFWINIDEFIKVPETDQTSLWRLILTDKLGTSFDFQQEVFKLLKSESGKKVQNSEWFSTKEGNYIVIFKTEFLPKESDYEPQIISQFPSIITYGGFQMEFCLGKRFLYEYRKNKYFFVIPQILPEITIRLWNNEDIYNNKKVKDILSDKKYPRYLKKYIFVLENEEGILFLQGK